MKSYNLEVIDIDTILHELFGVDSDSIDQIIDELNISGWTYGDTQYTIRRIRSERHEHRLRAERVVVSDTPYTLVDIDAFLEFLQDCVDNEICQTLTQETVNYLRENIPVGVYINLEGSK